MALDRKWDSGLDGMGKVCNQVSGEEFLGRNKGKREAPKKRKSKVIC